MSRDVRYLDPWADEWVRSEELVRRCYVYAREARTLGYRLRRLWKGMTTHIWEPDEQSFILKAAIVRDLAFKETHERDQGDNPAQD